MAQVTLRDAVADDVAAIVAIAEQMPWAAEFALNPRLDLVGTDSPCVIASDPDTDTVIGFAISWRKQESLWIYWIGVHLLDPDPAPGQLKVVGVQMINHLRTLSPTGVLEGGAGNNCTADLAMHRAAGATVTDRGNGFSYVRLG